MPPPPRDLPDDAISEILLRLPPDEPECLFRAALVCKPWLRTLSDPAFLSRYRDFHGAPPLLGLLDGEVLTVGALDRHFILATAGPRFPILEYRDSDSLPAQPLDCRHGRLLASVFRKWGAEYLVCDPITGDCRRVPEQHIGFSFRDHSASAVFCAAAGCDHLNCHGGPFYLVRVFTEHKSPPGTMSAAMYSSETSAWSTPVTLDNVPYVSYSYSRGPLIGDEIYFALQEAATIVKYDWANNLFSVVKPHPPVMYDRFVLTVMEDRSLGLARIEDSTLHLLSRRVTSEEGIAEWVQCRVIDMEKMMPMAYPSNFTSVVGFPEGVDVIIVSTDVGLFMMELKSGRVRKLDQPNDYSSILPYMSFYTPDRLLGGPAAL